MANKNSEGYQAALRLIEENYITKKPILTLNDLGINEIPKEIGKLNHLIRLEVRNNYVNLRTNSLRFLPKEIGNLSNLQALYLSNNQLTSLPEEIEELKNLRSLYLEDNRFATFPKQIEKLTSLRHLYLSNNRLSELSKEIGKLTNLRLINLENNQLTDLPEEIGKLNSLQELNLNNNHLSVFKPEISELVNLKNLFLRDNQFVQLSDEINKLVNLELLTCRNNKISTITKEIGQMKKLQVLSLRNNHLKELPKEIGDLSELNSLYLDNNDLEELPKELEKLTKLKRIVLHGNQLNLPLEIIEKWHEPQKILSYYFNNFYQVKEEDKQPLKEVKVLLVGQGRVGKTSLVRYLVHNKKCKLDERSTHGILREKWNFQVTENETQKKHDVRLNVWDFGGQDIQHQTHQFFLSKRSLYLLVLDAGYDETRNKLDYWLKKIQIFGENSPVFVAINKSDENLLKLAYNDLKEKYNIKGFFNISCKDGREILELREAIKNEIGNLKEVFQPIRKEWFAVKETLENIREDYISIEDYRKICKENGVTERQSQDTLLFLLHELGVMLNFKQYETKVLNPEWVTRGVYQVVTSTEVMKNNGILTPKLLNAELEELNEELSRENKDYLCYPPEKYIFITDLMQEFELCYPIAGTRNFFVPALLPKESHYVGDWKEKECLGFRYNYGNGLLHESIISRFIVKMNRYILNNTQWLTGVLLNNEHGNKALVKADVSNQIITILIDGYETTRREFLGVIRDKFNDIHDALKANKPVEEVPHYDYPNHFIPYEHLLQLERAGIFASQVTIDGVLVNYDVKRLINGVSTPKERKAGILSQEEKDIEKTFSGDEKPGYQSDDREITDIVEPYLNDKVSTITESNEIAVKEKPSLFKTMATFVIIFVVILTTIGFYDYLQKQGYLTQNGLYLSLLFTVVFIMVMATFTLVYLGAIPANLIPDILKPTFGLIGSDKTIEKKDEITKNK